ncbi:MULTISPECIES: class I SAM-dependent methyltransferase [Brucella]|uniref:class I SAM-dependent methyltransferase n=1 Tax=Brucella TaxID=234 RepID=UPI00124CECE6|nr:MULTISPECIES: class I SAM-dependent methyltransferase [Brucella]KAB2682961.1 class I SAM-dependent methyltransferase [Brucella pseudintermedia]MBR7652664.1 class I SAM-dependent methyltransferase [Brucella oryzae]
MSLASQSNYANITFNDRNIIKRWLQRKRLTTSLRLVDPDFRPRCIVDYGAGNGEIIKTLAVLYPDAKIICFEPTQNLMAEAKKNLIGIPNVVFTETVETIAASSVDLLFCLEVFEHLPSKETEDAFNVFKRVLSDQGRIVIGLPVEVGIPSLYKGLFRMVRRFGAYDATIGNVLRSFAYLPPKERPCSEIAPGFGYYFDHMGFDYRAFRSELKKHFLVEQMKGGPFPAFGAAFNPEINFLAKLRA